MPAYSVEKPMRGASTAYKGRKSMVKMKDPGIAVGNWMRNLSLGDSRKAYQQRYISSIDCAGNRHKQKINNNNEAPTRK